MKYRLLIPTLLAVCAGFVSCSRWTETESITINTVLPWEQDPQLWEEYKAAIRDYKSRDHSLIYVRFENSPEGAVSEKGFMRCLPDSLDIVSLTNAENFSRFDAEDMEWMKSIGTRVLYQIDFASDAQTLLDQAARDAAIDRAIATVQDNALDGFSLTGIPKEDGGATAAAAKAAVERLAAARSEGQLIAFEGNPAFIPQEDIQSIDLFVLATAAVENGYDLRNTVLDATDWGVPKEKMLLAADFGGVYYDSDNAETPVLEAMADNVIAFGPMAGLALYGIESDYYHYDGDWLTLRSIISRMNH